MAYEKSVSNNKLYHGFNKELEQKTQLFKNLKMLIFFTMCC